METCFDLHWSSFGGFPPSLPPDAHPVMLFHNPETWQKAPQAEKTFEGHSDWAFQAWRVKARAMCRLLWGTSGADSQHQLRLSGAAAAQPQVRLLGVRQAATFVVPAS